MLVYVSYMYVTYLISRVINYISDIDECAQDIHNCSKDNAFCNNTVGLFNCTCKPGFTGDGHNCAGTHVYMYMQILRFSDVFDRTHYKSQAPRKWQNVVIWKYSIYYLLVWIQFEKNWPCPVRKAWIKMYMYLKKRLQHINMFRIGPIVVGQSKVDEVKYSC